MISGVGEQFRSPLDRSSPMTPTKILFGQVFIVAIIIAAAMQIASAALLESGEEGKSTLVWNHGR